MDEPDYRLDAGDANTTLSLHSNGQILGFFKPITHIDLYPNGGATQPGCGFGSYFMIFYLKILNKTSVFLTDPIGICSHSRSYEIYGEAVVTDNIISRKCKDFVEAKAQKCAGDLFTFVGEANKLDADGIYWFPTNKAAPFAHGV